jgi:hypothetical protein
MLIIMFRRNCHWSLSYASSMQCIPIICEDRSMLPCSSSGSGDIRGDTRRDMTGGAHKESKLTTKLQAGIVHCERFHISNEVTSAF